MIQFNEKTSKRGFAYIEVIGNSHEEIWDAVKTRIRAKSVESYRQYLKDDLNKKGNAIIDSHAGCGTFYDIYVIH